VTLRRALLRIGTLAAVSALVPSATFALQSGASDPASATAPAPIAPQAGLPFGVDFDSLHIAAPEHSVLIRSKGKKLVTVGEYNAWLGSYPLDITSKDPAVAKKQAAEQLARFKLIAQKAREAGYESKLKDEGSETGENALVLSYIRDQMFNATTVSDEDAQAYRVTHAATLTHIESADAPPEVKLMGIKSTMLGEQLKKRVERWMEEGKITYDSVLR
jgi:hypothetical protein